MSSFQGRDVTSKDGLRVGVILRTKPARYPPNTTVLNPSYVPGHPCVVTDMLYDDPRRIQVCAILSFDERDIRAVPYHHSSALDHYLPIFPRPSHNTSAPIQLELANARLLDKPSYVDAGKTGTRELTVLSYYRNDKPIDHYHLTTGSTYDLEVTVRELAQNGQGAHDRGAFFITR